MGKRSFFPRLALVNLVRNSRYYGPYLLSCGALAAMYYILRFLTWNEVIQTVRGAAYLQVMMSIGCFVVALFSTVLLLYANSFVMKRRQKELGLYNILGLEKRHIAALCFWETLLCAAVVIPGGIAAGILLSKLILLLLLKLVQIPVQFGFSVSVRGVGETAALLGVLFLLALLWNLLRLGRSRPIELLHSDSAGEREPKTKRLLAVLGLAALLGGYAIALTTRNPVNALMLFFVAVILVMLGTYCLFTAGSIALLKRLRANKGIYYQTRNFTAISGLLYRMKQNAVGLANICILACMVLVTVSGTLCLYLGAEKSLDGRYPDDILVTQTLKDDLYQSPKKLDEITLDMVIMAPEMVRVISADPKECKTCELYLLTTHCTTNLDSSSFTELYADYDAGRFALLQSVREEQQDGCVKDWADRDVLEEEYGIDRYEAWYRDEYFENHFVISLEKLSLMLPPDFIENTKSYN